MPLESPNPHYRSAVEQAFAQAAFVTDIGIELVDFGPGWCESALRIQPRHLQHTGIVHAGVQSTMADHTAGAAAISITPEQQYILTVEFKLHLLRPGAGESLRCRAQVLKPGRNFQVVESEVYALDGDRQTLISKLTGTMAVLPRQ
ncbi:PaaI family thioesterase [Noviherbaspirillum cavernae]|uniref:Medium/long-chain acyl-CoA thioesterase YigI n=1 Tax=Noviherbaspirillum cavernae TaxID=2320862 RepID=A0A418X533_9BURK|nr:PaaI family thioesterase [Noviherbaspirillum cavernae]RJG07516.1 PaaI family thioesterase [Noviherbaspirillum cavernae]